MKKLALLLAFAVVATAPTATMAKARKKPAKPAQQVQMDPQKMTYDEAMAYNKKNLGLVVKALPLVLPSWSLPIYFAMNKDDEQAKPGKKKH